jgi:hypothetical protein
MIGLGGGFRLLGRMFRIFYQNIKASHQITKMPVPIVAILGASKAKQEELYVQHHFPPFFIVKNTVHLKMIFFLNK